MAGKKRRASKSAYILLIGLPLLIILAGCILGIYREGSAPKEVQNVSSDVCFNNVSLSWDKVKGADGYVIYASKNSSDFEEIGRTDKDTTEYSYEGYTHDTPYEFKVCAFAENNLTGKQSEGDGGLVTAEYDSSEYAQKIPVLTYHGLAPGDAPTESSLEVPEATFEEQMKYLHDNGYTTLTPDEFCQWHAGEKDFPTKTVMITFDDGCTDVYALAYPIIKKYDMAATLFCIGKNTSGVTEEYNPNSEKTQYVKEDVIEKVRNEYPRFAFESHTYNMHSRIDGKPPVKVLSYDQITEDFKKNEKFGFSYLAYPWGNYSDTVQQVLKDCNYKMAFTYRPFYYALRSDDTYAINRIKMSSKYDLDTFIKIVSGESESRDNPDAPENQV